jgi:hypothetical protein
MIVCVFVVEEQTGVRMRWSEGIKGESKEAGGLQAIVPHRRILGLSSKNGGASHDARVPPPEHPDLRLNMFHFCTVYCDNRFEMTSFLSTAFFPFSNTSYLPLLDSDDTIFVIHDHSGAEQTEKSLERFLQVFV